MRPYVIVPLYIPRVHYSFKNIDEQKGRLHVLITPAGLEEFFFASVTLAVDKATQPDFDPTVIEKVMQLGL
jgi:hypothetical protein